MARAAGVSEATVSRALRRLPHVAPATAQRIEAAAAALGFTPSDSAAALATGRTRLVSVVVPSVVSWFYGSVLEGVDATLRAAGFSAALIDLAQADGVRRRLTARELRSARPIGHVVVGFELDAAEQALLREASAPIVTVGARIEGVPGIGIPEERAAEMVVEHLAALGHRRIGHVGADREEGMNPAVGAARRAAWAAAVARLGLESRPEWFGSGAFRIEASRDAALAMLGAADRPTAVFAASDISAFGVLLAAQALGLRVPEDVSVAGIDDHPFAAAHDLTTVRQSPREQGERAALVLLRGLGVGRGAVPAATPLELVQRASTAPPA
ncbi:LacI family DNA-binding transcriptional regulator [Amnibacterium endophyticum]|uniref:LacI family DNA-binding transcriptional regulator n=1 Tax=Amnibacterium endophyticum TaxID=2109337 RepID=A0ABW4LEW3_9MICO